MSSIPIFEEDEFHPTLISKPSDMHISSQLNSFLFKEDYNSELEELILQLIQYKKELEDSINEGKKIQRNSSKQAIYQSLENILIQASYITSDQLRHNCINKLCKWYKDKSSYFLPNSQRDTLPKEVINKDRTNSDFHKDHFEYKHRTKYLSATELKQYRIKKVRLKKAEASKETTDEKKPNKQKDIFALTKGSMKSTFYTSLQGGNYYATSEKLRRLNLQEILKENTLMTSALNIPVQENKSSYSILRPPFKYDLLTIEKQILKQKNKDLNNKRTIDEIRAMVNDFGCLRAQYKGAMNKKYEIKKMVQNYYIDPAINKLRDKSLSQSHISPIKLSLIDQQQNEASKKNDQSSVSKQRKKKKYKALNKTVLLGEITHKVDSTSSVSKKEKIQSYFNKSQTIDMDKISLNNIKNIQGRDIIKDNTFEKSIDLNMRLNSFNSKKYIIDKCKNDMDELPNDCISRELFLDQIFRSRNINKSRIDIQEINNKKDGYLGCNKNPLSISDMAYIDVLTESKHSDGINNSKRHQSLHSIDYAKNNFKQMKNNYLLLRKTMANKREDEFATLNKSICSKSRKKLNKSALYQSYVNPLNENLYPASYLPHLGSGLLVIPYIS